MTFGDVLNGAFELLAAFAVLNHCRVLNRQRSVAGMSVLSVVFFTGWGFWNMYYYPSLGQTFSFVAGCLVAAANLYYVRLLLKYRKAPSHV